MQHESENALPSFATCVNSHMNVFKATLCSFDIFVKQRPLEPDLHCPK